MPSRLEFQAVFDGFDFPGINARDLGDILQALEIAPVAAMAHDGRSIGSGGFARALGQRLGRRESQTAVTQSFYRSLPYRSFQWIIGSPATGAWKQGIRVPLSEPM